MKEREREIWKTIQNLIVERESLWACVNILAGRIVGVSGRAYKRECRVLKVQVDDAHHYWKTH